MFQVADARAGWLEQPPTGSPGWSGSKPGRSAASEVAEATRLSLSYTPNDLVDARLGRRLRRRPRLRRHAPGHRVRQRAAPGVPAHRRPARRPPRSRLPADPPRRPRRRPGVWWRSHGDADAQHPRAGDRGHEPLRAGRQRLEADRRPVPLARLRARLDPVPPPRAGSRASAASSTPSATSTTCSSSRPAASGWRPSRSIVRRAHRAGNRAGDVPPLDRSSVHCHRESLY